MADPRIQKIAEILVNYSTKVKKGDYVQIVADTVSEPLVKAIYELIIEKEAFPVVKLGFSWMNYSYYNTASDFLLNHFPEIAFEEMKKTDVYIVIRGGKNAKELTGTDPKKIALRQKIMDPINKERLKKRWVLFEYPSHSLAQEAEMSTEEAEDFVYNACLLDWKEESKKLDKAMEIMSKGKLVRIVGEQTDISFSIAGRKFKKGDGTMNMPDGEIFTAPEENSTSGFIKFSYPAIYGGREVSGVYLEFKDGKIIKSSADKNEQFLKEMIATDEGSHKLGELGIGLNPKLTKPIKSILFDEKLNGTIHLAIGSAYQECLGTNKSAIHWDFIKDMRNGKIFLDGKLVYENGEFI